MPAAFTSRMRFWPFANASTAALTAFDGRWQRNLRECPDCRSKNGDDSILSSSRSVAPSPTRFTRVSLYPI